MNKRHSRSISRDSPRVEVPGNPRLSSSPPGSPLPTQTFHRDSSILASPAPLPALFESAAGGAHYAGFKVDTEGNLHRRRSSTHHHVAELKHDHQRILDDLTELYCCRPTLEIFDRTWSKDAEFEDPLCRCKGFKEYAAQWFALPKFVSHSEQVSRRVMASTESPNRLIYFQSQLYTLRVLKRKKLIESVIVVDLDDNDKIIRLVDQWNGDDLPTRYGASLLRTANGKVAPWLIHVPKVST